LLSVNGVSVEGENHEKAVDLLKAAEGVLVKAAFFSIQLIVSHMSNKARDFDFCNFGFTRLCLKRTR